MPASGYFEQYLKSTMASSASIGENGEATLRAMTISAKAARFASMTANLVRISGSITIKMY